MQPDEWTFLPNQIGLHQTKAEDGTNADAIHCLPTLSEGIRGNQLTSEDAPFNHITLALSDVL